MNIISKIRSHKCIRSRAPLRLSFGGGGTELSPFVERFGGHVLNATLNMYALTTLKPLNNGKVIIFAKDRNEYFEGNAVNHIDIVNSLKLHKAVYNRFVREFNENEPLSIEITTSSDAPVGSGLGASSTLTVSIIHAFSNLLMLDLDEYSIANLAYEIERLDLGLMGGKQDQYAASFGGFNFIEFHKNQDVTVNPLRINEKSLCELESSIILYYTGTSRESSKIIDEQTKLMTKNNSTVKHLQKIKEITLTMKQHLLRGKVEKFALDLDLSWQHKKLTASQISNENIDRIYEKAKLAGAIGGKISGAGGGGFLMLFCDPVKRMDILKVLEKHNGVVFPCSFSRYGARSWKF